MTQLSYTSFLNNYGGEQGGRRSPQSRQPATDGQRKFYFQLCDRKKVKPQDISRFSKDQLGKEIEKLLELPDSASPKQLAKIKELEQEIIQLGGDLKPIPQEVLDSLTGGQNGTASSLIQSLYEMRQQLNEVAPPSDKQVEILVSWFMCPDIPFEDYDIKKKVDIEVEGMDKAWRYLEPHEFAEEIKKKITKSEASHFIDRYRGKFYQWRQTRISPNQIKYIRTLEARLSDMYVPQQVEMAIIDGEVRQITKPNSRIQYRSKAYEPMPEMQLIQLSFDQAQELISRLKSELDEINNIRTMNGEERVYDNSQQIMEDNRVASNLADAKAKEYQVFNDLLYAVESILGYKDEEIHAMAQELILEDLGASDKEEYKQRMKEFFMSTVTTDRNKNYEKWEEEMKRIYGMCEESAYAMDILSM